MLFLAEAVKKDKAKERTIPIEQTGGATGITPQGQQ